MFQTEDECENTDKPQLMEICAFFNILYCIIESNRDNADAPLIIVESQLLPFLFQVISESSQLLILGKYIPIKKLLLLLHKCLLSYENYFKEQKEKFHPNNKKLKSRNEHVKQHKEVVSSFMFKIPSAIIEADNLLKDSLHIPREGIFHTDYKNDEDEFDIYFSSFLNFVVRNIINF